MDNLEHVRTKYSKNVHPSNLPEFLPRLSSRTVSPFLPEELTNEPWTFSDTGSRLELKSRRPKFLFEIDENGSPGCVVGTSYISTWANTQNYFDDVGMKRQSNVSVLSVYDNYGLDVTYEYLWYLYYNKQPEVAVTWLTTYLAGSFDEIVGPTQALRERHRLLDTSPYHTLYLCSEIMRALQYKDSREPKLLYDLTDVPSGTLPSNILSRVLGSVQISKKVAEDVMQERCSTTPTYEELAAENGLSEYDNQVFRMSPTEWLILQYPTIEGSILLEVRTIRREGTRFIYNYLLDAEKPEFTDTEPTVGFMLIDYMGIFRKRGCEPLASCISVLSKIRRETHPTEENVELICSWVLSLGAHLDENEVFVGNQLQIIFENIYELASELDRLIELTIQIFTSDLEDMAQ